MEINYMIINRIMERIGRIERLIGKRKERMSEADKREVMNKFFLLHDIASDMEEILKKYG